MDGYPKFDGFSLQDDTYITEDIVYRTIPERSLDSEKIARRPGVKTLSTDFSSRTVSLRGYIIADSVDGLRTAIDNLHTNVTRKNTGAFYLEADRVADAIVSSLSIADPHYSQSMVPFEVQFLLSDPFYYGTQQSILITVTSGTSSLNETITISGSVFAEPIITFTSDAGSEDGYTTTSGILITYGSTSEVITWSGTNGINTLAYEDTVTFDYPTHSIIQNTAEVDVDGVFARWEPGETSYVVTFSGTSQGGTLQFSYQPRYL